MTAHPIEQSLRWRVRFTGLRAIWALGRARDRFLRRRMIARMRLALHGRRARRANNARVWGALGDLRHSLGDIDGALVAWRTAFELDPEAIDLYDRYAYEQWQRGEWDDAIGTWAKEDEMRKTLARRYALDRVPITILDRNWSGVIGGMGHLDAVVKQQILDGVPLDQTVLLALPHTIHNRAYLDYWRRYLPRLVDDDAAYVRLQPVTELLRRSFWAWECADGSYRSLYEAASDVERRWEAESRGPLLELEPEHRERGRACLASLGVPEDAWFVGLHVREDSYHDVRNADVATYRKAMEAVVERGGWVIRMGDRKMPSLEPMEHVVDYAHSDAKSDWMDVFLWAEGRFLIGTDSGPIQIPGTFGVPVVQTNWSPLAPRYWYRRDLHIPKLYRSERHGRMLSFPESIRPPIGFAQLSSSLASFGVRVVDNTPCELAEVVVEMLDRVEGKAVYTAEDEELQTRFESLEPPMHYRVPRDGARLGREFLRRYAELLDEPAT